jgi:tetratricopeptide (TPR) repeat protein
LGRASHINWLRSLESVMSGRDPVEYERFVRELTDDRPAPVEYLWIARYWITGSAAGEGLTRGIEVLRLGIDECPDDDPSLKAQMELDLGQFLVMAGDYRASAEAFERVLEIDPESILALNNAAYLYVEHIEDYQKALRYAERAAEMRPNEHTVLDTLGWAYYRVGRYEEAEEYLRRSIKARPTPDNHFHLAAVLVETARSMDLQPGSKRLDTARTYLSRSAELGPSDELQVEIDRLAEEIRTLGSRFGRSGRR